MSKAEELDLAEWNVTVEQQSEPKPQAANAKKQSKVARTEKEQVASKEKDSE